MADLLYILMGLCLDIISIEEREEEDVIAILEAKLASQLIVHMQYVYSFHSRSFDRPFS